MIEHIQNEVLNFLKSDKPGVIVIKGNWGTGKTYAWNEWLKEAVINQGINASQYAYVSLFGCNSLDELKAQTFQELIPVDLIPEGVSIDTVAENIKEVAEKKRWKNIFFFSGAITKKLNEMPWLRNLSIDVWRLGWMTVKNTLVCIDDIERIGEGLRIKDVYGLVSVLREQKKCKVILILNDESIEGANKKDYEDYREKVVDIELHFDPETDDLVKLVFDETYPHFAKIKQCICGLRVKNIRTIQKIKTYLDKLSPNLEGVEDVYHENAINSIVLFTVLHFSRPDKWPTLDQVLETNTEQFSLVEYSLREEAATQQGVTTDWAETMNLLRENYTWGGADEIDQLLGSYVKQGYVEPERLQEIIEKSSEDTKKIRQENEARARKEKVRELLFSNCTENLPDIISAIDNSLEANVRSYPALGELNEAVKLLRKIKQETEANKLIAKYIEWAKSIGSSRLNPDSYDAMFTGSLDADILAKIQKPFEELRKQEIAEHLETIDRQEKLADVAERSPDYNLNEEDYETLSYFKSEDFEVFLRNSKIISKQIRNFLEIFLLRSEPIISDCLTHHNKIRRALIEAIKAITNASELNKYRFEKYVGFIESLEGDSAEKKTT